MAQWAYTRGLHDLGNGCYAYLQPDGSWGWGNAGLVVEGGRSLLVDTLFDLKLTREMLEAMRRASPAAADIGTLINTHANGDHTFGNQLVKGAEIVAARRCAEEMEELPPERLAGMTDEEAARDIAWTEFRDWGDDERIFINVNAAYREFKGDKSPPDIVRLFALMGQYHNERKAAARAHGRKH